MSRSDRVHRRSPLPLWQRLTPDAYEHPVRIHRSASHRATGPRCHRYDTRDVRPMWNASVGDGHASRTCKHGRLGHLAVTSVMASNHSVGRCQRRKPPGAAGMALSGVIRPASLGHARCLFREASWQTRAAGCRSDASDRRFVCHAEDSPATDGHEPAELNHWWRRPDAGVGVDGDASLVNQTASTTTPARASRRPAGRQVGDVPGDSAERLRSPGTDGCTTESFVHRRPVISRGHPRGRPDDPANVWSVISAGKLIDRRDDDAASTDTL